MSFYKLPENDSRYEWTTHIKNKMLFYRLSEQKIKMVVRSPMRREEGIAPTTIAVMQRSSMKKKPEEIWVMYRTQIRADKTQINADKNTDQRGNNYLRTSASHPRRSATPKVILISAWRYPGITKPGKRPDIPEDVWNELRA